MPERIRKGFVGGPLSQQEMAAAVEQGFPIFTSPDNRFATTASPASSFQTITIPGTDGQSYIVTDVLAKCDKKARIFIEFTDIGKAFTFKPVDWRTFEKVGYPIMPNFLELAAGSHVKVTFYNDDVATLDGTIALVGILV